MSAHLYWSLKFTGIAGSSLQIGELALHTSVGGSNVATGGTALATSEAHTYTTFYASNAFDSNTSTYWIAVGSPPTFPHRLAYQLPSALSIVEYAITINSGSGQYPTDWTLEYSDDGISWTVAGLVIGHTFTSDTETFLAVIPPSVGGSNSATENLGVHCSYIYQDAAVAQEYSSSEEYSVHAWREQYIVVGQNNSASEELSVFAGTPQTATTAQCNSSSQGYSVLAKQTHIALIADSYSVSQGYAVSASVFHNASVGRADSVTQGYSVSATQDQHLSLAIAHGYTQAFLLNDNYLAINYALDNKSITTYSNFNFTGSCRFNGRTLFVNGQGLFEHSGLTDNGVAIVPSLKTGKMDEVMGQTGLRHTQQLKKIPTSKMYVSADKTGGSLDLIISPDTQSYSYNQAVLHDGFAVHAIKIGRKIKYNHMSIEVRGNACSRLHIESIRFDPTEIKRSER